MYSGAGWIEQSFKVKASPLGTAVANLLGRVALGIYHLRSAALERVDWTNKYCIEYIYYGDLSTFDFDNLTALVVFAHDEMIRVSIQGCGPGYMKMQFHQRTKRTGSISQRYPTIEDHIDGLRARENAG